MIKIDEIPENPGVYLMHNGEKIIYVGKAKNLKKRVQSYFKENLDRKKTEELVKNITKIDYIITNTEIDALILENNLIKKYKPKYNIALKDSKTYPYIHITNENFPKLILIRNTKYLDKNKNNIYGPYTSGGLYLLKTLKKIFKIRDCNRDMEKTYDRPCLKYYMNMCIAPCCYKNNETLNEYRTQIIYMKKFLDGSETNLIKKLEIEMKELSENMEFEKAIIVREKINSLKKIIKSQITEYGKDIDEDVFLYKKYSNNVFLCVLNVRDGKIIAKNFITIKENHFISESEFENIFLAYYDKYKIVKNIILDSIYKEKEEILKEIVKINYKENINIYFPVIKSRKKEILDMAYLNFENEIENYYQNSKNLNNALYSLKSRLYLRKMPIRIECFDISNIQGKDAVAAMSVAVYGKLEKSEYRKFKINTKDTPDDYAMMCEVIERRYKKLDLNDYPDLILIDGGLGQLSVVKKVLTNLDIYDKIDVISIAEKEDIIYKIDDTKEYIFENSSEELKILQRLRDEAHRFGVSYHRLLRKKRVITSDLLNIEGIGQKRSSILLKKFRTVNRVYSATLEELKEVVPEKIAKKIIERGKQN
ncbi:MAG: excinuclease ABC subunit UvrC [Fusobacteria bacterium]|nr:excinuclease ABC subunit UvrC [Fusobacteriota bacterium]